MKKLLSVLLCCLMFVSAPSCTPDKTTNSGTSSPTVDVHERYSQLYRARTTAATTTTTMTTTLPSSTRSTTQTTTKALTTTTKRATRARAVTTKKPAATKAPEEPIDQSLSRTVYITPTGKRYHFLSSCGGKNSYEVTLSEAKGKGLTPCQKCAS